MLEQTDRIVVTGAAGLVGQNLVTLLLEEGYRNIVAIDKHVGNLATLHRLHPEVRVRRRRPRRGRRLGPRSSDGATVVVQLHAQIAGLTSEPFVRNNVTATADVLDAVRDAAVPFLVHASSSVVNSVADDDYTEIEEGPGAAGAGERRRAAACCGRR